VQQYDDYLHKFISGIGDQLTPSDKVMSFSFYVFCLAVNCLLQGVHQSVFGHSETQRPSDEPLEGCLHEQNGQVKKKKKKNVRINAPP